MAEDKKKAKRNGKTTIRTCSCKHEYQDAKYDKGKRVHNIGGSKDVAKYTCTVCGKKT